MKKAFLGPIGDDLPSIIALMLALGIFFSAIAYTMEVYNQKIAETETLKGSLEIGRAVMDKGLLTDIDNPVADHVAFSYGLSHKEFLDNVPDGECVKSYRYNYLVAMQELGGVNLHTLIICTEVKK